VVNSPYYGEGNMIEEFMTAATEIFGKNCLLQFEDFNSNDAFPLLDEYREKFLTYNDDIQGTASVTVAGLLGAVKLRKPECTDLIGELAKETFLFHGAGSANIGALRLLAYEAKVPTSQLFVTNSRGVIWKNADGTDGSYRNDEQKEFAVVGKPEFDGKNLVAAVENLKPTSLVGAVGVAPGCFTKEVVEAMVKTNPGFRPGVYALSNPKTQAEVTSVDCWTWSNGEAIYGSGTGMESLELNGKTFCAGQVNNVYIFPGMSMGAICCQAKTIPERLFLVAAEAVANSLDAQDLKEDRTVPHPDKIRIVGLNVAAAVVLEAQKLGLAGKTLGSDFEAVKAAIKEMMWSPGEAKAPKSAAAPKVLEAAMEEQKASLIGA
jgi:malate dehydrogenase (oxaloacetate-decarboxylating)(NADP+)